MSSIIWMTDPHLATPGQAQPMGVDAWPRLRAALAEAAARHAGASRAVLTGDLAQRGEPATYAALREALAELPMPYRLLPGNHDDRAELLAAFPDTGSHRGFVQSFEDLGDAQLLYLDTLANDGSHHGELCGERLHWLEVRLAEADARPLLVFQHHPPFAVGIPAVDRLRLLESDPLERLLRARTAPTHLFCGHIHRSMSGRWAGHPFATLKSLHVQIALDATAPKLQYSDEPPGYGVIEVAGDDIQVHYRDLPA
ncbi:phosphodiesterase [Luteimonas sp. SJ-92]|uniref:Phosphodiesterase n=1 Tax=Luteimonas salinisoli TaxID=2752307 RepID=A0A853JBX7_9GAMM|nr:phosphodiesterase [Luteimonas salinisoli]NZA26139.1 phosphodiesterase [Luteimonas salinisoli]